MTIPISFPTISGGQVLQGGGAPDPYQQLLASLMQGVEMGQNYQRLQLERERMGQQASQFSQTFSLQQAAAEREAAEFAARRAAGAAVLDWLNRGAPPNEDPFRTIAPGQHSPLIPGLGAAMSPQLPPQARMPAGRPSSTTQIAMPSHPLAGLAGQLRGVAPEAVMETVQRITPLLQMQNEYKQTADRIARINAGLANIKDPAKQGAAVAWLGLAEGDVRPTEAQLGQIAPELAVLDPSTMNSAWDAWRTTGQPWGRVRSAYRLPKSQIPDEIVFTGPPGSDKMSEGERSDVITLPILMLANEALDSAEAKGFRVSKVVAAYIKKNPTNASTEAVRALAQTPEEREYISAAMQFGHLATFTFSGKAATDKERVAFINDFGMMGTDPAETVTRKAATRQAMIKAIVLRSEGRITASQAAKIVLQEAPLNPDQRRRMQGYLMEATKLERGGGNVGPGITATDIPSTPETAASDSAFVSRLIESLPDSALGIGGRRPAASDTLRNPMQLRAPERAPNVLDSLLQANQPSGSTVPINQFLSPFGFSPRRP